MATSPEAVRSHLGAISAAAIADLLAEVADVRLEDRLRAMLDALGIVVPSYYDAAGILAVTWYEELRSEVHLSIDYTPSVIGNPAVDWIDREVANFKTSLDLDLEQETARLTDELSRLAEKEIARGFRDSILGNVRQDREAIGWSRIARPGACKLCAMLADKGAVYSESSANFAAHTDCHCAARPEFAGGEHGPEASVEQYLASTKRRTPAQRARLRDYLNTHYPDARG